MDEAAARRSSSMILSWYCGFVFVALIVLSVYEYEEDHQGGHARAMKRACDEVYVVGEGETLHTIGDKCGDPYIVEENPHIHDPDDVYPGLVIKITPLLPYYV